MTGMPTPLAHVFVDQEPAVRSAAADLHAAGLDEQADALLLELRTGGIVG